MILVIDNYDSFTYNLVQYLGELGADVRVRRNDQVTLGDKNKILLWYKPHAKADKYRAIFGDLRIEDVTADQVPTTRPAP